MKNLGEQADRLRQKVRQTAREVGHVVVVSDYRYLNIEGIEEALLAEFPTAAMAIVEYGPGAADIFVLGDVVTLSDDYLITRLAKDGQIALEDTGADPAQNSRGWWISKDRHRGRLGIGELKEAPTSDTKRSEVDFDEIVRCINGRVEVAEAAAKSTAEPAPEEAESKENTAEKAAELTADRADREQGFLSRFVEAKLDAELRGRFGDLPTVVIELAERIFVVPLKDDDWERVERSYSGELDPVFSYARDQGVCAPDASDVAAEEAIRARLDDAHAKLKGLEGW